MGTETNIRTIEHEQVVEAISLRNKYRAAVGNFFLKTLYPNLTTQEDQKKINTEVESIATEATVISERSNFMARLLHQTSEYQAVRTVKELLKGPTDLLLGFCVDGRIKRVQFGLIVNAWEVPAGEIVAVRRPSDGKLIPESSELRANLTEHARHGNELIELFFAHYDSKNPDHGCAAISRVIQALKLINTPTGVLRDQWDQGSQDVQDEMWELSKMARQRGSILTDQTINAVCCAESPEASNIVLLEEKSIEAVTNWFNSERIRCGHSPQEIVGIAALYDTATNGVIFNPLLEKEKQFSTTEVIHNFKEGLTLAIGHIAPFGKFKGEKGINPKNFLEYSQKQLEIMKLLLEPNYPIVKSLSLATCVKARGRERMARSLELFGVKLNSHKLRYIPASQGFSNELYELISDFVDTKFKREVDGKDVNLTETQKQSLRFYTAKIIAMQWLKGLTGEDSHKEEYASVALGGEFAGKYDTEQMFGSNAADLEGLVDQLRLEREVMRASRPDKKRPIVFISTSISREAFESRDNGGRKESIEAIANNLRLYEKIMRDSKLKGGIIPVGVLIDRDTREIIDVLDHSSSF